VKHFRVYWRTAAEYTSSVKTQEHRNLKETFKQLNRVTFQTDTHANLWTFQFPSAREIYEQNWVATLLQVPSPLNIPSNWSWSSYRITSRFCHYFKSLPIHTKIFLSYPSAKSLEPHALSIHTLTQMHTHICRPRTNIIYMHLFWVVTPCGFVDRYQRFGETYCLHLQGW
jgi:hypothetical protein